MAAGAAFVACSTVYHAPELDKLIERAIKKRGFAVVEAVSYCHTTFGRVNNLETPVQMMEWLKENSITLAAAEKLAEEARTDKKIVRGVYRDEEKPEFTALYDQVIEQAHGQASPPKRKVRLGWT
jgi:2-oxoglutarate ferredoxin oxidoreductase subunit beta